MKIKQAAAGLMVASVLVVGSISAMAAQENSGNRPDSPESKIKASMQVKNGENTSDAIAKYAAGLNAEEKAAGTIIGASDGNVHPAGGDQSAKTVIAASDGNVKPAGSNNTAGTMIKGGALPAKNAKPLN